MTVELDENEALTIKGVLADAARRFRDNGDMLNADHLTDLALKFGE